MIDNQFDMRLFFFNPFDRWVKVGLKAGDSADIRIKMRIVVVDRDVDTTEIDLKQSVVKSLKKAAILKRVSGEISWLILYNGKDLEATVVISCRIPIMVCDF